MKTKIVPGEELSSKSLRAEDYIERAPEQQKTVDAVAKAAFGRTPKEGQCVMCGSAKMDPGDFRDELSLRESRISFQCQSCQDETDAMLLAMEEDDE